MEVEVCPKCSHYDICESPCYFVQQYLMEGNTSIYQQSAKNKKEELITIVYTECNRVKRTSELSHNIDGEHVALSEAVRQHSTDNTDSPFRHFEPKLKMTGIFIDRFFDKMPYEDIAVKYDISVAMARCNYHKAVNKLTRVLEAMDSREVKRLNFAREKVHGVGKIPEGQRYFLLNKLFGMVHRDCRNGRVTKC